MDQTDQAYVRNNLLFQGINFGGINVEKLELKQKWICFTRDTYASKNMDENRAKEKIQGVSSTTSL